MVISTNSQLGLRFKEKSVKLEFLKLLELKYTADYETLTGIIHDLRNNNLDDDEFEFDENNQTIYRTVASKEVKNKIEVALHAGLKNKGVESFYEDLIKDEESKYFLICDSVYEASKLIKVSCGFTGRTLKDIAFGKYTYLIGKNKMIRFMVMKGVIIGMYFDDVKNKVFNYFIELENGGYDYDIGCEKEFSMIMQVLTFVELGEIEIVELSARQNNGGKKDKDKITNSSNNTVFVVDSTWNKLLIRTDGFGVRGHFKLQPCGIGSLDRKLIWVDAFEKHGYTRRPKAEIVR